MRKLIVVLIAFVSLVACGSREPSAAFVQRAPVREAKVQSIERPTSLTSILGIKKAVPKAVPKQPVPPKPIVAVEPAPPSAPEPVAPPEPEPIVPGSANDPDGPILCPGLPHPAHHRPCPAQAAPVAATPTTKAPAKSTPAPTAKSAPSADLASIVECEDNDNPAAGPTGYASNTGNGYYGGYQWLPSTFNTALTQALNQGKIDQETYDAWYGVRPDKVPSWVQDAAASAHIAAGGRGAWPNC